MKRISLFNLAFHTLFIVAMYYSTRGEGGVANLSGFAMWVMFWFLMSTILVVLDDDRMLEMVKGQKERYIGSWYNINRGLSTFGQVCLVVIAAYDGRFWVATALGLYCVTACSAYATAQRKLEMQ